MRRFVASALFLFVLAAPIGAATLNVPSQYPTIPDAIRAANAGDVIQVAAGVYSTLDTLWIPGQDTIPCSAIMKSGITLRGAGPTQTIIDPDSLGRGIHCGHVTGVTIRDLAVRRAFWPTYGSGILARDTSNVAIFNCDISGNFDGGVIFLRDSNGSISTTTMNNNLGKQGGGLAIEEGCSPMVTRCTISGNQAPSGGGAFVRAGSNPIIDDCTISDNFISGQSGAGGGITVVSSSPTIRNSRIVDNDADGQGGGIAIFDASDVLIENTIIQGNRTLGDYGPGGGVYCDFAALTMQDCIITRNSVAGGSSDGAGLYSFFGDPVVLNQVTIAANANNGQPTLSGGVTVYLSSPTITKSIIAFNNPGQAMVCTDASDDPQVGCCDIFGNQGGDAICGTDLGENFSLDPLFCDLGSNNFRLQMTSPCYPGHHPNGAFACDGDRIGGLDPGCSAAEVGEGETLPAQTLLLGNQPNPFRPATTIAFELVRPGRASLTIFDVSGRQVRALEDRSFTAGRHQVSWDGRNDAGAVVSSGVYFYSLVSDGQERTRRMVLAR